MTILGLLFSLIFLHQPNVPSDTLQSAQVSAAQHVIDLDSTFAKADQALEKEEKGSAGFILEHILDSDELDFAPFNPIPLPKYNPVTLGGYSFDISPTKHTVYLFIVALLLLFTGLIAGKVYRKNTNSMVAPKGFANLVEVLVVFVRDDIAKPSIGEDYRRFMPFLLTLFFFVLISNYMGLLPWGLSITGNINVTAGLALITFVIVHISSRKTYWGHLFFPDVPLWLYPIMVPVEVLGVFTKPFALAIRLFANMTGGHLVIFTFIGLIFILNTHFVAFASIPLALFVYALELIVGFIQAYIFAMLSAVYIGMAVEKGHH